MKTSNPLLLGATLLFGAALSVGAFAHPPADSAKEAGPTWTASAAVAAAPASDMTHGEVRKVDLEQKKVTLRHGEIKNLEMPPMTMVFQVKDPALLDNLKTGDKVRFTVEKIDGAITITRIETGR